MLPSQHNLFHRLLPTLPVLFWILLKGILSFRPYCHPVPCFLTTHEGSSMFAESLINLAPHRAMAEKESFSLLPPREGQTVSLGQVRCHHPRRSTQISRHLSSGIKISRSWPLNLHPRACTVPHTELCRENAARRQNCDVVNIVNGIWHTV